MKNFIITALLITASFLVSSCDFDGPEPISASEIKKATVQVKTDPNGNSVEQLNIIKRLEVDNQPGSVKHLYIISPLSGEVLLYSAVVGKVTSGSKRLSPGTISGTQNNSWYPTFKLGNGEFYSDEVMSDDGTYGSSAEYIYWFDTKGRFHQHFRGTSEVHVSDFPLRVNKVGITIE